MGNKQCPQTPSKAPPAIKESVLIRSYRTKHALRDSLIQSLPEKCEKAQKKETQADKLSAKLDEIAIKLGSLEERLSKLEAPKNTKRVLFEESLVESLAGCQSSPEDKENARDCVLGRRSAANLNAVQTRSIKLVKPAQGSLQAARDRVKLAKMEGNRI